MKCVEIKKQIDSFIDDELSPSLRREVELHLKECPFCEKTLQELQTVGAILKKDISVPAFSRLDGRMLKAFSRHHAEKSKPKWWTVFYGQFIIPKPIVALALLTFAVFTGLAFQLGKITATDIRSELPVSESVNLSAQPSELNLPSKLDKESEAKTSDAPVVKFIEVPIVKEKVVTRVVYVTKPRKKAAIEARLVESKINNFALNNSVNENRYSTQVNLKEFKPVAEMKTQIIKKDENYEK